MKIYKDDWKWFGFLVVGMSSFIGLISVACELHFQDAMILLIVVIGFCIAAISLCMICVWVSYKWLIFKDWLGYKWSEFFNFGGFANLVEGAYGTTNRGKETTSTYTPIKSTYRPYQRKEIVPPRAEFFGRTDGEAFKVSGEPESKYLSDWDERLYLKQKLKSLRKKKKELDKIAKDNDIIDI